MSIAETATIITQALWPQGDIRDPLGVWGARRGVTGDATGGSIAVDLEAAADQGAAYLYTCYSVNASQLTGTVNGTTVSVRLLTNWPNVDPVVGVQGYGSHVVATWGGSGTPAPTSGFTTLPLSAADRFLLLFDPRPSAGALTIVSLALNDNTNLATYSFEGYGYYWDRSVLNAPGGPRHPGSS